MILLVPLGRTSASSPCRKAEDAQVMHGLMARVRAGRARLVHWTVERLQRDSIYATVQQAMLTLGHGTGKP